MQHLRASAPLRAPILLLRTPPPEKPRQQRRGLALADPRIDLGPVMACRLPEEPRPMLDRAALRDLLMGPGFARRARVYVERPFSGRFINAVVPAHRFFEATIITLEDLGLGYEVLDSAVWQKPLLGPIKGSAELKRASALRGVQLYPQFKDVIARHGDADGLLIAHHFHYAHR